MPEERFRKDIGNKKFGIEVIDYLRAEYKISRTACALRFADIGNYPLLIVYAENNIIRWSYSSEDFPFKWMINDKIVPRNTVMGDYFNNNHVEYISGGYGYTKAELEAMTGESSSSGSASPEDLKTTDGK